MKNLEKVYVNLRKINNEGRDLLFNLLHESVKKDFYNIYNLNSNLVNFIDNLFIFHSDYKVKELRLKEVNLMEYIRIIKETDFSITTRYKEPKSTFYFC